jgi:hypothetical protein
MAPSARTPPIRISAQRRPLGGIAALGLAAAVFVATPAAALAHGAPLAPQGLYTGVMVCLHHTLLFRLQLTPEPAGVLRADVRTQRLAAGDGTLETVPPLQIEGRHDAAGGFTLPAAGSPGWPVAWRGVVLPGGQLLGGGAFDRPGCMPWVAAPGDAAPALWSLMGGTDPAARPHAGPAQHAALQAMMSLDLEDRAGANCAAPIPAWLADQPALRPRRGRGPATPRCASKPC